MELKELDELKKRANQVRYETGAGKNTSDRIGSLFYDIIVVSGGVYSSMKKRVFFVCYSAIIISLVSIIVSLLNVGKISTDGANLLGWIVGILAILVTILIGFQIYKTIELENKIDRYMADIEMKFSKELEDIVEIKIKKITSK